MLHEFTCSQCSEHKTYDSDFTTGYGTDKDGNKVCYACCGLNDAKELVNLQPKEKFHLYLDTNKKTLSNWPGSLRIHVSYIREGRHNIAGKRFDTWFNAGIGTINNHEFIVIGGNVLIDNKAIPVKSDNCGLHFTIDDKTLYFDHFNKMQYHAVQYGTNTQIAHIRKIA